MAQVKRLAEIGSIPSSAMAVLGPLVNYEVMVDESDRDSLHSMNIDERHNGLSSSCQR